jgi:hypothetical protein
MNRSASEKWNRKVMLKKVQKRFDNHNLSLVKIPSARGLREIHDLAGENVILRTELKRTPLVICDAVLPWMEY